MQHLSTQVIIAGAGPTGLSLAAQLLRYGVSFILIDKEKGTTSLSKAIVVQARSLEVFDELGILPSAMREGSIVTAMNLFYKGKKRAGIHIQTLGEGLSSFPFALSLEQSKTEKLLSDFLTHHEETIRWGTQLMSFEENNETVTAFCKNDEGEDLRIEAYYLVGCDGAKSFVRHQLNIPFEGSTVPKMFYVADVVLDSAVICSNEVYLYLVSQGIVLFFPMEGAGHYRVVGNITNGDTGKKTYAFQDVEASVRQQLFSPVLFKEVRWFSTYKVHSRKARSFRHNRCFIAGDAAHIHTPVGGQGMNTGILDTYNLAWKLAYTLKAELKDEVLETYNTERGGNATQLLRTTDRMFDMMTGKNQFLNFIRLYIIPSLMKIVTRNKQVKRQIFPLISQTGIAYPYSFLTAKSRIGKVKAGDRMHFFVFADGTPIFKYLTSPVFKLVYFGLDSGNNSQLLGTMKITIALLSFTEIPKKVFGNATNFYVLLRPDNHISYIGYEIEECKRVIEKWLL